MTYPTKDPMAPILSWELVPAGKRNQVVNEALRKELEIIRRKTARNRLVGGSKGKHLSTREIVSALEKDRRKHG